MPIAPQQQTIAIKPVVVPTTGRHLDLQVKVTAPRQGTDLPVGVGVGVSTGDQAAELAAYADGVIVGSAFVRCLLDNPDDRAAGLRALAGLTEELAAGVRRA